VLNQPLQPVVIFNKTSYHNVLGGHNIKAILFDYAAQTIVVYGVVLEAPQSQTICTDLFAIIHFVFNNAQHRTQSFERRAPFFAIAKDY